MTKQPFLLRGIGVTAIVAVALAVLYGCSDLDLSGTPELSEDEIQIMQTLTEKYRDARIKEAYDSLKTIYPDAKLTPQGGILVIDSVFTEINGVPLKHQRWIYPPGVPRPSHDEQPWLSEYRKYNQAIGRDPNTPFPFKELQKAKEAAIRGDSIPGPFLLYEPENGPPPASSVTLPQSQRRGRT